MTFGIEGEILGLEDLPVRQKLTVTAFLATGIAAGAPDALGQPMLVFAATPDQLLQAFPIAGDRGPRKRAPGSALAARRRRLSRG